MVGFGNDRGGATYAALDLGTNNCRLLVARPSGEGFRVVDAFSRIVRLGEGVSSSRSPERGRDQPRDGGLGHLPQQDEKQGRYPRAPDRNRSLPDGRKRRGVSCDRVSDELGLELEVIDRETERGLAATGCTPLIDPQADGAVLFDIGGGSSELVRLERSQRSRCGPPLPQIRGWISVPHGVVTLAERYGGVTVTRESYEAMVVEVADLIAPFVREHGGDEADGHSHARDIRARSRPSPVCISTSSATIAIASTVAG